MHEPISTFRPGWKSSEFWRLVVIGAIVFMAQFHIDSTVIWAHSITILCASFAIGRGIFKKSRLTYVGKGERTTEFWITVAGMVAIFCRWYFYKDLPMSDSILAISIIEAGYQLGRGIGKSFIPRDIKLPFGMG